MVDLPQIPRRLVTTETPQSSLTRSDLMAPFAAVANALGEASAAAEQVAVPLAEKAGAEAVRTDDNGNLIIDRGPLPIVGKAGDAFERQAKLTYIANVQPKIEDELTKLRLANRDDPRGFKTAADSYIATVTDNVPDPVLRTQVGRIASEAASHNYRSVLVQADANATANAAMAYKSRISDLDNRLSALARQGGTDTPEYQSGVADLRALYGELQSNPRFKYPADRVKSEIDEMTSRHKGEAVVGQAMNIYDKATPTSAAEARKFLTTAAWDVNLNLSPAQRQHIVSSGMQALEGRTAENKAAVDANKKLVNETIEGLKSAAPYDDRKVNDLMDRSLAMGDVESYYRLSSYRAFQPFRAGLNTGTEADRQDLLRRLQGEQTASGLAQATEENRQRLTGAGIAPDPANLYIARYFGPDDAISLARADPNANAASLVNPKVAEANKAIFDRNPTVGQLLTWADAKAKQPPAQNAATAFFDATRQELVNDYTKRVGADAEKMVTAAETALGKGRTLNADEIKTITNGIAVSGRYDLLPRLDRAAEAYDAAKGLGNQPASVRDALRAQLQVQAAQGADPKTRAVVDQVEASLKAMDQGMKDAPYRTAAVRNLIPSPEVYDFSNPAQIERVAVNRAAEQGVIRNYDGVGPMSVFEGAEAAGLKTALTQGDPKAAADTLARLNTSLPPDVYRATMSTGPVKEALDGMVRGYEPTKLNAAMTTLDRLWRSDPQGFSRDFGADAVKRLQVWQSWHSSMSPTELADRFKRADDPAFASARKALSEEADKELKSYSVGNVVTAIDRLDHPLLSRVPFIGPSAPTDALQSGALKAEFDMIYKGLRSTGVDAGPAAEQAAARLKTSWGASDVAGGQFMRLPPERYYPAVNGSHDWMRKPLEDDIAKAVGKPRLTSIKTDIGPRTSEAWTYNLVADNQTEADIGSGRPPSYQVLVTDKTTGRTNAPHDAAGNVMRYRWDAAMPQEAARTSFARQRFFHQEQQFGQSILGRADLP